MDMNEPDQHAILVGDPQPAKRLTRKSQAAILLLVVGLAVAIFIVGPAGLRQLGGTTPVQQATEAAPATAAQPFKVTDKQWAALKVQPIEERIFQDASETDGKIAIDGLGGSYGVERLAYYRMPPEMGPPETTIWEYPRGDDSWRLEMLEFLDDIRLGREPEPGLAEAITPAGDVRTLPSMWAERGGIDGFYMARLTR